LVNSFKAHSTHIHLIKQSPFNTYITNYAATCSSDGTVKIWNVSSSFNWTLIRTYSYHSSEVFAVEWLDNDTLASSGFRDQIIKIWSLNTGQIKRTITTYGYVQGLKLLNNNNIHLAADVNGTINIYNINDGYLVSSLEGHARDVNDFVQLSDDLLASASDDLKVQIWNLTTKTHKFILTGHKHWVTSLKQITSSLLASGSFDGTIKLWNITSGQLIRTLTGHANSVGRNVDLINSQTLVSGSFDQTIKLWDWSTGKCLSTIQTNSNIISLAVININ
jgi:WD40 repeat protein